MSTNETRPNANEVELALMVARPGVRLGVKPAFVLAREVRALRAELVRLREELKASEAKFVKLFVYVQQLECRLGAVRGEP